MSLAALNTVEPSLSIEFLQYPILMLLNAFPVPYSWLLKGPIGIPCSQMPAFDIREKKTEKENERQMVRSITI